jgi:hypothetical protein
MADTRTASVKKKIYRDAFSSLVFAVFKAMRPARAKAKVNSHIAIFMGKWYPARNANAKAVSAIVLPNTANRKPFR